MGACEWALISLGAVIVLVVLYSVFERGVIAGIFDRAAKIGCVVGIGVICVVVSLLVGSLLVFVTRLLLRIDGRDSLYAFGSIAWGELTWKLPLVLSLLSIVCYIVIVAISFWGGKKKK